MKTHKSKIDFNLGKWIFRGNNDAGKNKYDEFLIYDEFTNCIAKIPHLNSKKNMFTLPEKEAELNARIIAHTPTMFYFCEMVIERLEHKSRSSREDAIYFEAKDIVNSILPK